MKKLFTALMLSLTLSACSMMPTNPDESFAAAYIAIDSVAQNLQAAQLSGVITPEREKEVVAQLHQAVLYVQMARNAADIQSQELYLQLALAILTPLKGEVK